MESLHRSTDSLGWLAGGARLPEFLSTRRGPEYGSILVSVEVAVVVSGLVFTTSQALAATGVLLAAINVPNLSRLNGHVALARDHRAY